MGHNFGHRNRRRYPDLPVVDPDDPAAVADAVGRLRETLLIMLGDKQQEDRTATWADLAGLGLINPVTFLPRPHPRPGTSHARLTGVLNTTIATGVWTPLPFGTMDVPNSRLLKSDGSGLELRVSGEYLVMFNMFVPVYASSTNKDYAVSLRTLVNGGSPAVVATTVMHEEHRATIMLARILTFAANDVVTFEFSHDNTSSLAINEAYSLEAMQMDPDAPLAWARGIPQPTGHQ